MTSSRQFKVVMRVPSAAICRQGQNLLLENITTSLGTVRIDFRTRWLQRNESVTVPGNLWIEICGFAPDLKSAINTFTNGLFGINIIAISSNAAIGNPEVEVAFESTPGAKEREYFQSYISPENNELHRSRVVDLNCTLAILNALVNHQDGERLMRAANQYNLALQNWKHGLATMTIVHLWVALETLTKPKIRAECLARGLSNANELAAALAIDIKQLDSTIRRDFLLHGDEECYKQAKEASDGFEHGYLKFDNIRDISQNVRHRTAGYIRRSFFELVGVNEDTKAELLSDKFSEPLGYWPFAKYLWGMLRTEHDTLAAPGNEYPFIKWSVEIQQCEWDQDGKMQSQINEQLIPELAKDVTFVPGSHEVWGQG